MLLRTTSAHRDREVVSTMRAGGVALLMAGAAGPRLLRRAARMRMALNDELWGWADPPGWVMEFVGGALIAAADRRARRSAVNAPSEQRVILGGVEPRTQAG